MISTLMPLGRLGRPDEIAKQWSFELPNNRDPGCAELTKMAEQELAAYSNAVTALFGAKQAQLAAKDWLQDLETTNVLPIVPREWRVITIDTARRLATRLHVPNKRNVSMANNKPVAGELLFRP